MLISVDPHSGVPVYRQLMEQIKLRIATGSLAVGAELPSTRSLSAELKVNPMTVSKAYRLLEEQGVIERRPGLPSVVANRSRFQGMVERLEELHKSFEPTVRLIRELGIQHEQAVAVLRRMLAEEAQRETKGSAEDELRDAVETANHSAN